MAHGLDNCIAVLRRWASVSDGPLPGDWASFRTGSPTEAMQIELRDPELVGLLSGRASAGLRADALMGKLPEAAPTLEARRQADIKEEVRQLTATNPYGQEGYYKPDGSYVEPVGRNLTDVLKLERLAPDVAAEMRQAAEPKGDSAAMSQAEAERINAEVQRLRMESLQLQQKKALEHGGGY